MKNGQMTYISNKVKTLLTFPGEQIILLEREHWSVLIFPIFTFLFLFSFLSFIAAFISIFFFHSALYTIASFVLIATLTVILITKIIIDWYFHMYIITNRKVLEVLYNPLFSDQINDVLLNQVKCTEVDAKITGIFRQMLDIGDVVISFDKLAPHEEFVLRNVKFPRKISMFLADKLSEITQSQAQDLYYADRYGRMPQRTFFPSNITTMKGGENL